MFSKKIDSRIADIRKIVEEKSAAASRGEISTLTNDQFQEMLRGFNVNVVSLVIGAELKKTEKKGYRLRNVFQTLPSVKQLNEIRILTDRFYNEVTIGYTSAVKAPVEEGTEDMSPKRPSNPNGNGGAVGSNVTKLDKITGDTFAKMLETAINKKLTGADIMDIAAMGDDYRAHNTKWAFIFGATILLVMVGGFFAARYIMDKKNDSGDTCDGEGGCGEFNDIGIDTDEIPEVTIEAEDVPVAVGAF